MTDRYDGWVELILPAEGAPAIVRSLLDLAPNVHDVRTQGNGDSVLVPPDLADAYHATLQPQSAPKTRKPRARKTEEVA